MPTLRSDILIAHRWLWRALKKGEWLWLMLAIVIAASSVTLVKQLSETVQQSMLRQAADALGADLVLRSTRPVENHWRAQAEKLGLQTSQTTTLVTMALTQDTQQEAHFQLVQLKAVENNFPLRGTLQHSDALPFTPFNNATPLAWIDEKLPALMPLTQHSTLTLGTLNVKLGGSVRLQQGFSPMNGFAPTVLIPAAFLNQTGLLGPGSRVTYELQLAGDAQTIQRFAKRLEQQQKPEWQIISATAPNEDLQKTLDTAWLFLDLAALTAVLVAGLSILIASRFYLSRWQSSLALLRALGAGNAQLRRLFALQLGLLAFWSSLLGSLLGLMLFKALTPLLAEFFHPLLTVSPWSALLLGIASGILVLWSFAWQAFQQALHASTTYLLKAPAAMPQGKHWLLSFGLLLLLISLMLGVERVLWIVAGLIVGSTLLYLSAAGLLRIMRLWQGQSRGWLRIGLSSLLKEPGLVKIQVISLGLVLFILMLMTFVRQDLLQTWQATLPQDTPNTFVMNIQPDQKPQVARILADSSLAPDLLPMARGRLVAVNGAAFDPDTLDTPRARRLLQREANIAVLDAPPAYNVITARINHTPELPAVSVEVGIAELFGIQLGDTLSFNFSGQRWDYQVTSLRTVEWQSFRLNFFFIVEPVAERPLPLSYIGNFHLPEGDGRAEALTAKLAQQTPGVLLIDVRRVIGQIQEIMTQATWAVSALYGFTMLASLVVVFTAILASQQGRVQSWLLLRTLGAGNREIIKIGLVEFALLGGLAGLLAAVLAQIASGLLSQFVLETDWIWSPGLWLISLLSGIGLLLVIGLLTQQRYLRQSPQQLKRSLQQI